MSDALRSGKSSKNTIFFEKLNLLAQSPSADGI